MKKYYYAKVDKFYDKRYDNLLECDATNDDNVYLKNIVTSYGTEKGFLGISYFTEYLAKFPIIVETIDKKTITDLITGEVFYMLPNELDYKGISDLILYLGDEVTPVTVAEQLKKLLPEDVERYKMFMEKIKTTANIIKNEELQRAYDEKKAEQNAHKRINDFKKMYRKSK